MSTENNLFTLAAEANAEPFRAKIGDDILSFAHHADVDQFALAELYGDDPGDLEFITRLFRLVMDDGDFAKLRAAGVKNKQLTALFSAYKKHCGVDAGESAASSDSSAPTE